MTRNLNSFEFIDNKKGLGTLKVSRIVAFYVSKCMVIFHQKIRKSIPKATLMPTLLIRYLINFKSN